MKTKKSLTNFNYSHNLNESMCYRAYRWLLYILAIKPIPKTVLNGLYQEVVKTDNIRATSDKSFFQCITVEKTDRQVN